MSANAVLLKNTPTLSRTARRYSSQQSAIAAAMPTAAPISGPTVCPDALAAVHRNRVVSRPSRPTDRNAVSVSAPAPIATARSTSPRRCDDRVDAVRRIQKIMPVTRQTARTLSRPPTASCCWLDKTLTEKVSTAAKAPARLTAPTTPSQIGAADSAGSPPRSARAAAVFFTAASRMVTTRPASSPSRSPISRLGTLSAQVTVTKVRLTLLMRPPNVA